MQSKLWEFYYDEIFDGHGRSINALLTILINILNFQMLAINVLTVKTPRWFFILFPWFQSMNSDDIHCILSTISVVSFIRFSFKTFIDLQWVWLYYWLWHANELWWMAWGFVFRVIVGSCVNAAAVPTEQGTEVRVYEKTLSGMFPFCDDWNAD